MKLLQLSHRVREGGQGRNSADSPHHRASPSQQPYQSDADNHEPNRARCVQSEAVHFRYQKKGDSYYQCARNDVDNPLHPQGGKGGGWAYPIPQRDDRQLSSLAGNSDWHDVIESDSNVLNDEQPVG